MYILDRVNSGLSATWVAGKMSYWKKCSKRCPSLWDSGYELHAAPRYSYVYGVYTPTISYHWQSPNDLEYMAIHVVFTLLELYIVVFRGNMETAKDTYLNWQVDGLFIPRLLISHSPRITSLSMTVITWGEFATTQ